MISETFVYVRFPYHMWSHVEHLATSMSQFNVGPHHFKAYLSLEARKKLQDKMNPRPKQKDEEEKPR